MLSKKTCLRIGVTAFLIYLSIYYWPWIGGLIGTLLRALSPVWIGCSIAFVLNLLMGTYERFLLPHARKPAVRNLRRPFALLFSVATVFVVLFLLIRLIIPELVSAITVLTKEIPDAVEKALQFARENETIRHILPENVESMLQSANWQQVLAKYADVAYNWLSGMMSSAVGVVGSVFSSVTSIVLGIILAIYILLDKDSLGAKFYLILSTYLPDAQVERIRLWQTTLNQTFRAFFGGQFLEAMILGVLCVSGMLIFRFPYATMIGTLVGCMNLIPIAGSLIGSAVGAFMILTVSPMKALLFVVFIIVLQQIESNLIYPRVVGNKVGLPGLWVLVAITVGGGLYGILGMLVAVPIGAALYKLLMRDVAIRHGGNIPAI